MDVQRVVNPDDDRLRPFLHLKDRDIRRETGWFLAEGEHVVRRAFEAGLRVRSVLVVQTKAPRVAAMIDASGLDGVQVLVCDRDVIARSVGFQVHQGLLAAVEPPPPATLEDVIGHTSLDAENATGSPSTRPSAKAIVVCPEIGNVDNVGLLVRVCAGLGVDAMLLGERCADPWYRRAVRVSMGTVFRLPIVQSRDIEADLARLRDEFGFELLATVIDADATPLRQASPGRGFKGQAILLGSEGYGLQHGIVERCHQRVRIPMHHEVDSLNVAVAAGIVIHHLVEKAS